MSVIPTLGRLRQEDGSTFDASHIHIPRTIQKYLLKSNLSLPSHQYIKAKNNKIDSRTLKGDCYKCRAWVSNFLGLWDNCPSTGVHAPQASLTPLLLICGPLVGGLWLSTDPIQTVPTDLSTLSCSLDLRVRSSECLSSASSLNPTYINIKIKIYAFPEQSPCPREHNGDLSLSATSMRVSQGPVHGPKQRQIGSPGPRACGRAQHHSCVSETQHLRFWPNNSNFPDTQKRSPGWVTLGKGSRCWQQHFPLCIAVWYLPGTVKCS